MKKLGLDPKKIFWLDIPYTSNVKVRSALIDIGIPPSNFIVSDLKLLDFYALAQRKRVHKVVKDFIEDPPKRLLVLDDGSYFLESAMCFKRKIPYVAIVEQTTRGLIKIEEKAVLKEEAERVTVINVAKSKSKEKLESPFIGRSICMALKKKLGFDNEDNTKEHNMSCLVLGYGNIGRRVVEFIFRELKFKKENIHICDPKESKETVEPFKYWDRSTSDTRFDLVVGCSGRTSFTVGDFIYLNNGAVLASASSGSIEFARRDFIELADLSEDDDINIDRSDLDINDLHSDIPINFPNRRVTFLNGGFPLNFGSKTMINCIPAKYIQPTVAMMVRGAIQALETDETGVIDLDEEFCDTLVDDFRQILGDESSVID
ncbi:MAG: hypothetical protein JSU74_08965 [Candidatus Zixiibacteriota bacterium]|nr:MAG: hypothetical protein JSU74_08965 [candidate division Zixibacteria bacterium]